MKRRALALVCAFLVFAFSSQPSVYAYLTASDLDNGSPSIKSTAAFNRTYKLVAIDPGHGGTDPGAIGNGIVEKEINLDISLKVRDMLLSKGYTVVITRTTDTDVNRTFADVNGNGVAGEAADELQARVNVGNNAGADIYISIHHNAASFTATGTEAFYNAYSTEGQSLATKLAANISSMLGFYNRGAKVGNYYITNRTLMPAVISEAGFLTNASDAFKLSTPEGRRLEAEAIVKGIDAFYGVSSPPPPADTGTQPPATGPAGFAINDVTADNRSDAVALYAASAGTTSAWAFRNIGTTANPLNLTFSPVTWWQSGGFDVARTKAVTGDFDGDKKSDIIALYNYGGTTSSLWFFKALDSSFANPANVFSSAQWDWTKTKLVSGDFNGDGKDELFAFYTYGGNSTGVFVFEQNAQGQFSYREVFHSDGWNWNATRLLSVKEAGKSKVIAAYNYGGTTTGLWTFELGADGKLTYPSLAFVSGNWNFANTAFLTGDVNADGRVDVIAFYNYGGTTTGAFAFKATGLAGDKAFSYPERYFLSTQWAYARSTFIPGDFNGDGKSDAGAVYDYGGGKTGIWVFASTGTQLAYPVMTYETNAWNNVATKWLMPY
ncbi:MAG: N-acetylmuramoyl-L-alanine amidase [Candidatus Aquicultorales bacterium]